MGKYFPKKGKVLKNNEWHKAQVISTDLSILEVETVVPTHDLPR